MTHRDHGKEEVNDHNDSLLGEVSTKDFNKRVWLIKIPKYLGDVWIRGKPEPELGFVVQKPPSNEISVTITGQSVGSLPKDYNLVVPNADKNVTHVSEPPMYVFSENSDGQLAIEGYVECRGELQPVNGLADDYRFVCRDRLAKSKTKVMVTQTLNDKTAQAVRPIARPIYTAPSVNVNTNKRPAQADDKDKKTRMPEEDLLDLIFAAFEDNPYWDLKGLLKRSNQPQAYLKETLAKVCIYNKKGPNRLMYELKPEYKNSASKSSE